VCRVIVDRTVVEAVQVALEMTVTLAAMERLDALVPTASRYALF